MKFRAKHLFILLLLLSAAIQFWIVGMAYAYKEKRSSPLIRMWLSPQCTY